jgi:VCBS repeat-containing protein
MDEHLWRIVETEREQDERLFSDADLTPRSTVSDGQGGTFEVDADGSWALKIDGFLA